VVGPGFVLGDYEWRFLQMECLNLKFQPKSNIKALRVRNADNELNTNLISGAYLSFGTQ
jgi:hypothetical protein